MTIKSLAVKDRISRVCAAGVSDVTKYNPRSLEEVETLLNQIDSEVEKHKQSLKALYKALKTANSTSPLDKNFQLLNPKSNSPETSATEEAAPKSTGRGRAIILDDDISLDQINRQKIDQLQKPMQKRKSEGPSVADEVIEFVRPKNLPKIKEQYDLLEELAVKKEQLEAIINSLSLNFKGHRGSGDTVGHAKQLHAAVTDTMNKTLAFLNSVAIKTEPADFAEITSAIVKGINPVFSDSYDKVEQTVYVSTSEVRNKETGKQQTALTYTHYLCYRNFVDDEGYAHDRFFLVLTGILILPTKGNKPVLRKYVTTLQKFVVPGKFKPGTRFRTADEGLKFAFVELEQENFSTLIERTPIPAAKRDVTRLISQLPADMVKSADIVDGVITVMFNPAKVNKANYNAAVKEAFAAVANMIRGRSKASIKYRKNIQGKTFGVDFILVRPDAGDIRSSRVDVSTLRRITDFIKSEVDLDEQQEQEILRILNS